MVTKDSSYFKTLLYLQGYLLFALVFMFAPVFMLTNYHINILYATIGMPVFIAIANAFCFQEAYNLYCKEVPVLSLERYDWKKLFTTVRAGMILSPIFIVFKIAIVASHLMHILIYVMIISLIIFIATIRYPFYVYLDEPYTARNALKQSMRFGLLNMPSLLKLVSASILSIRYNAGWIASLSLLLLMLLLQVFLTDMRSLHLFIHLVFYCHLFTNIALFTYLYFLDVEICGDHTISLPED